MNKENILYYQSNIKTSRNEDSVYAMKYANQQMLIDKLEQQCQKQKEAIDKVTNELFILKDMIYKPETREENFEIQRKISSIIKRLNGKEVSE